MIATATQTVPEPGPDTRRPEEVEAQVIQRFACRALYGRPRAAIAAIRALAVLDKVAPGVPGQIIQLCLTGRPSIAAAALRALAGPVRQARKREAKRWCR
jgi:hypothetical protein